MKLENEGTVIQKLPNLYRQQTKKYPQCMAIFVKYLYHNHYQVSTRKKYCVANTIEKNDRYTWKKEME